MTKPIANAVIEAQKFNGSAELKSATEAVLNNKEDNIADAAADKAMEAVERRAACIVKESYMHQMNISASGIQANSMVEAVFQECLSRLAIILPDGWRTAKAFELLEESFTLAKRSIAIWDYNMTKLQKEKDGESRDS